MPFRIVSILALIFLAACSAGPSPVDQTTAVYLDHVSMTVAGVAERIGTPVERSRTVAVARSDGGVAVFLPSPVQDGGFVGWLELPKSHACAARLPAAYYALEARITQTEAVLTLREIDGTALLEGIRVAVERIDDDAPITPMARIALGPDRFLLGRWQKCSDGLGHCGFGLTLDAATSGCDQ